MDMRHTKRNESIVKRFIMTLPFCLFALLPSSAQTFTQDIQKSKQGEATLKIHQEKSIEDLVNTPYKVTAEPQKKQSEGRSTAQATQVKETKGKSNILERADTVNTDKRMGRGTRVHGYRIQVYAGGNSRRDRQQAETARNRIKTLFPDIPVSVHFHSPRWICRAGNFRTYEEAHQALEDMKTMGYKSAIIVKAIITVEE